ncbi:MAG: hypothetical protein PWQ74_1069 [Methanobacteriaceae archaeon]|nr:hypothetical protein [Methanobacteriaceae archaeon]
MQLIPQNHLQLIIEVAIILYAGMIFLLNLAPISLGFVLFLCLLLGVIFNVIFGVDIISLFTSFGQQEYTHPFGPLALMTMITALAAINMMEDAGVDVRGLRGFLYLLIAGITIFGGLMHRSFLLLWLLGLFMGLVIISKSFRRESVLTFRRVILFIVVVIVAFGSLELVSRIFQMSILSPSLRILRIEENAIPSIKMVLKNTYLIGHDPSSSYWGDVSQGFADGYISLPLSLILFFGFPFPIFYGVLVSKKDIIDYMLPGIFGWAYDFGYITLFFFLVWCISVIILGFKLLQIYRSKREEGLKSYLGREALLIGSLTAFISQAIIGLFIVNRSINGTALLTFIFLSSLIVAQVVKIKGSVT